MTALGSLFNKAKAVENSDAPRPTPPPPPKTGFRFGGAAAPKAQESASPPIESAPVAAAPPKLGGFKIGGTSPSGSGSAVKQESVPTEQRPPATEVEPTPATPRFPDETPATAPQRELAEDVSEEVKRFVANLDHLHTLAPEPELASSAIRNIMIELKRNAQYMKHVSDDDIRVMIQVMRETMGLTRATKEKAKAKRSAGKANSVKLDEVLAELADLDGL